MTAYIDLCLRADTEEAVAAALPWARDENGWRTAGDGWALDIIGPVVTAPGECDDDGEEIVPPVIDTRFHANLRLADQALEALVPAEIIIDPPPVSPVRVWG